MTRKWVALLFLAAVALSVAGAWQATSRASALGTSYSIAIEPKDSLAVDVYETITGAALFARTSQRLTADATTDPERLDALMRWAHEHVVPQYAGPGRVVGDNFVSIVRRGHGYCDQTAHVFATLARFAGYDVRLLFLRSPAGVSPHTVAEVLVEGRWVIVDPWLGIAPTDEEGHLMSADRLRSHPEFLARYEGLVVLDASYFERGQPFRSFPYQGLPEFAAKVWGKVARLPVVDVPDESARRDVAARPKDVGGGTMAATRPSDDVIVQLESARWAHLEGRYTEAVAGYRHLLGMTLPSDMRESVAFFLGLALLRGGWAPDAIAAFDAALASAPDTPWAPSIRFYRAEAKLLIGQTEGAIQDLHAANTPSANQRLASLRND